MDPEQIAELISEDVNKPISEQEQVEPGDMNVVKNMALNVIRDCKKLVKAAESGNIAAARATLGDINGEVKEAFVNINRLAQEQGLVEPEYRNDT